MLFLLLHKVFSFAVVESFTGYYLTNKHNILALTDNISESSDFVMISDGCGTHYYLKDLKTNLVLDHKIFEIGRLAIFNLLDYTPSQRWSLLIDSNGKFQFIQSDDYLFYVPKHDSFFVRGGACKTIFIDGFAFLDNASFYKGLRLPEIARIHDPSDSIYHSLMNKI
ncbi:hypothetical protein TUBRATIS_25350 [Tubulinosema ratisbonensis]|uniref:Uncharacterized protein n=1 Tax=Tubulinosema ratisbonensis TaxID=291195 RepID=A0A437AIM2_9MICR|nr:hypothetical protein TUBRATIS_25350 [Tubulinosema ratisbonensis]